MAVELNEQNFQSLLQTDKLVLIDFWAPWCGPCRALSPIVDEVAEMYADKVVVAKCNTDENNDLAVQFQVMSIPKLVFLKNGEVQDISVGLIPKNELVKKIDNLL